MKVLVTGITGTLGTNLLPILLEAGHEVIGFSRDELKQQLIPPHKNLTLYLGCIRDLNRVIEATRGVSLIYHLAALKHVDILEANPEEAYQTNIFGTMNVLHAQRVNKIQRVVFSSTDKAVYPINAYGVSKSAAEKLVYRNPNNIVCRWGNVLGSRGSVLPKFIDGAKKGKIQITDKRMTRFWITQKFAAEYLYRTSMRDPGGLAIPPMKSYPVLKLAQLVCTLLDVPPAKVEDIGIRPGEKLHEVVRSIEEGGLFDSERPEFRYSMSEMKNLLVDWGCLT